MMVRPILSRSALKQHFDDPARRQQFVTAMFNRIAPRYDSFTRRFSFGMDAGWKREIVAWIANLKLPDGPAVDAACGTGDLAFALGEILVDRTVVGADLSQEMLRLASARRTDASPPLVLTDMTMLPLREGSVALATAAYAFRNVPDFRAALAHMAAIVSPGGYLCVLDFYLPTSRIWRALYLAWLRVAGFVVGLIRHGAPATYEYISISVQRHVTADQFARELELAGFELVRRRDWLWGGISAHLAVRNSTRLDLPAAAC